MTEHTYVTLKDVANPETKPARTLAAINRDVAVRREVLAKINADIEALESARHQCGEELTALRREFRVVLDALFPHMYPDRT